jgi:hypothetical protein
LENLQSCVAGLVGRRSVRPPRGNRGVLAALLTSGEIDPLDFVIAHRIYEWFVQQPPSKALVPWVSSTTSASASKRKRARPVFRLLARCTVSANLVASGRSKRGAETAAFVERQKRGNARTPCARASEKRDWAPVGIRADLTLAHDGQIRVPEAQASHTRSAKRAPSTWKKSERVTIPRTRWSASTIGMIRTR